jgi:hypothetical protein
MIGTPACIMERNCFVKRIKSVILTDPPKRNDIIDEMLILFLSSITIRVGIRFREDNVELTISSDSASIEPETVLPLSLIAE